MLLEKLNKRDRKLVKSYPVISFLNFLNKVVEKLIAEQISQFCESNSGLCNNHIGD